MAMWRYGRTTPYEIYVVGVEVEAKENVDVGCAGVLRQEGITSLVCEWGLRGSEGEGVRRDDLQWDEMVESVS